MAVSSPFGTKPSRRRFRHLDVIKATGAEVFCWNPAQQSVKQAKTLGLPTVFTPYGPYYINRKQGNSGKTHPTPATVPTT